MKRALLIGNDAYDNFDDLHGCANDVQALHPLLARNENNSPNFECVPLFNLRDDLISAVDALLAPGADSALLFFAGHGGQTADDVVLCTADGTENTPGLAFSEVLSKIAQSPVAETVVLLDCCFAGGRAECRPSQVVRRLCTRGLAFSLRAATIKPQRNLRRVGDSSRCTWKVR